MSTELEQSGETAVIARSPTLGRVVLVIRDDDGDRIASAPTLSTGDRERASVRALTPDRLLVLRGCGVTRSADRGRTWSLRTLPGCDETWAPPGTGSSARAPHAAFLADGTGYVVRGSQRWWTTNQGASWEPPIREGDAPLFTMILGPRVLLGWLGGGVWRSTDGGTEWTPVELPVAVRGDTDVARSANGRLVLFAAATRLTSDDDGLTWQERPYPPGTVDTERNDVEYVSGQCDSSGACVLRRTLYVEYHNDYGSTITTELTDLRTGPPASGATAPVRRYAIEQALDAEGDPVRGYGCGPDGADPSEEEGRTWEELAPYALYRKDGARWRTLSTGTTSLGSLAHGTSAAFTAGERLWWLAPDARAWRSSPLSAVGCAATLSVAGRRTVVLRSDQQTVRELGAHGRWRTIGTAGDGASRRHDVPPWAVLKDVAIAGRRGLVAVAGNPEDRTRGGVARIVRGRMRMVGGRGLPRWGVSRVTARGALVLAWKGGVPRRSTDAGERWTPVRGLVDPSDVQVVDRRHVVALQRGALYASDDAGRSFRRRSVLPGARRGARFDAVAFADRRTGVVVHHRRAYRTADGGRRWRSVALPFGAGVTFAAPRGEDVLLQDALDGDLWRRATGRRGGAAGR